MDDHSPALLTRRQFWPVAGGTALALAVTPAPAHALPPLGGILLRFLGRVAVSLASRAAWAGTRALIERARWRPRTTHGRNAEERQHYRNAAPSELATPVPRVRDDYGYTVTMDDLPGYSGAARPATPIDLNEPEMERLGHLRWRGYPYRPYGLRRPLTRRDRELYEDTLDDYRPPIGARVVPVYAREFIDWSGARHTGFAAHVFLPGQPAMWNLLVSTDCSA